MEPREEHVQIRDSEGDLEICVGDGDVCLLIEGMPGILVWPATPDRPEHFFVRAWDSFAVSARLTDVPVCNRGLDPDQPIEAQLGGLRKMLVNGRYRATSLAGCSLDRDRTAVSERTRQSGRLLDWVGLHRVQSLDPLLLGTMPRELINFDRIRDVEQQITQGARPMAVLLTVPDSPASFVIAGHEVLEAYALAGGSPALLVLDYHTPRQLSSDDGIRLMLEAFRRCGDLAGAHYRSSRSVRSPDGAL